MGCRDKNVNLRGCGRGKMVWWLQRESAARVGARVGAGCGGQSGDWLWREPRPATK